MTPLAAPSVARGFEGADTGRRVAGPDLGRLSAEGDQHESFCGDLTATASNSEMVAAAAGLAAARRSR